MKKIFLLPAFCLSLSMAQAQVAAPATPPPAVPQLAPDLSQAAPPAKAFDKAPEFPTGAANLAPYLSARIQAPMMAIKDRPGGQVIVFFDVLANGNLTNFRIEKSLRKDVDNIIMGAVKGMPKWKPATLNGKPVKITYSLPLTIPAAAPTVRPPQPTKQAAPKKN
jgi:TonB family protein